MEPIKVHGKDSEALWRNLGLKWPGDCKHCRAKLRGGDRGYVKNSQVWCQIHEPFAPKGGMAVQVPNRRPQ